MTFTGDSASDSFGAMPTRENKPDWSWLQEKLDAANSESRVVAELDRWLEQQLAELEEDFATYVTPKSRTRDLGRGR
jgi:hypothetical protein